MKGLALLLLIFVVACELMTPRYGLVLHLLGRWQPDDTKED